MVLVFLVRRKKMKAAETFFLERSVSFPSEEENSGKVS